MRTQGSSAPGGLNANRARATTSGPGTPRQENTAKARRPVFWWFRGRWKLYAGVATGALALVVILLVLSLVRRGKQSDELQRLQREGLSLLADGRYSELQRADEVFRRLLQRSPDHVKAREARLFLMAVLGVEFGHGTDRAVDLMERTASGTPRTDLGAAGRCLAALAGGKLDRATAECTEATSRFPKSPWVAYAHSWVARHGDAPERAISLLGEANPGRARILHLRSRVGALLELGRSKEADALLGQLTDAEASAPWTRLLRLHTHLAKERRGPPATLVDPVLELTKNAQDATSAHQRRWAHLLLAEAHARAGKDAARRLHIELALAEHELTDPGFLDLLVAHLFEYGDAKRSEAVASAALARFPARRALLWAKASTALSQGRPKDAMAAIEPVPANRRTASLALVEARTLLALGQKDEARQILRQLRREHPELLGARLAWARLLTSENRAADALTELEEVLHLSPRNVDAIREAAALEIRLGKTTNGITRYEAAMRLKPTDPRIRAELMEAHLAARDWKAAENALDSALSAFPKDPGIQIARGRLLLLKAQPEEAVEAFREATKQDPGRSAAWAGLAEALLVDGQLSKVEEALSRLSAADPATARGLRGLFLLRRWDLNQRDPEMGAKLLRQAAEEKSAAGRKAAMYLIELQAKRRGRRAAQTELRRQQRRHNDRPEFLIAYSLALVEDDSNTAAISTLQKALRSSESESMEPIIAAELHGRLAQAHWQAGRFSSAQHSTEKALALFRGCSRAMAVQGILDYERGQFRSSRRHLRKAARTDPTLSLSFHYLGLTELRLGGTEAGRNALRRSLELRPKGPLADEARRALRR